MTINQKPTLIKLEDSPIWKEACDLAEHMYSILHEFPDEEKWNTCHKLRTEANSLMLHISQGVGTASPSGTEYDWGNARRTISGLKTMYRFAGRQKFIEFEPETMVRFDKLQKLIDLEVINAYKQTEKYMRDDIQFWQNKYELATKARHEN